MQTFNKFQEPSQLFGHGPKLTFKYIIRDAFLWGPKHQMTTTQKSQLQMFEFHVHQPPYLCSFAI